MKTLLDKKLYIAIDIISSIAMKESTEALSSRDIANKTNIGLRTIEQVLQTLVKNNILKAVRGAKGGYLLAKERRKINLKQVLLALESKFNKPTKNAKAEEGYISEEISKRIEEKVKKEVYSKLENINFDDIYNQIKDFESSKRSVKKTDFVI